MEELISKWKKVVSMMEMDNHHGQTIRQGRARLIGGLIDLLSIRTHPINAVLVLSVIN